MLRKLVSLKLILLLSAGCVSKTVQIEKVYDTIPVYYPQPVPFNDTIHVIQYDHQIIYDTIPLNYPVPVRYIDSIPFYYPVAKDTITEKSGIVIQQLKGNNFVLKGKLSESRISINFKDSIFMSMLAKDTFLRKMIPDTLKLNQ